MRATTFLRASMLSGLAGLISLPAGAEPLEIIGQPVQGGYGFQPAASNLAIDQQWLDDIVLYAITAVTLLVVVLLVVVVFRFNRRTNPEARRFSHNAPLEVMWTLLPVLILLGIGSISIPVLKKQQTFPAGDVVIKVTGNQWYWTYEYPDEGIEPFDSYMIGGLNLGGDARLTDEVEEQLKEAGYTRDQFLLAADTAMVVPVGAQVLLQITGADVIHSWTIPAFAVKQDAVPGRIAHAWFTPDREGIFFGQCSELCGKDHAFMPINVKVVSPEAYKAWVEQAKQGNVQLTASATGSATGAAMSETSLALASGD